MRRGAKACIVYPRIHPPNPHQNSLPNPQQLLFQFPIPLELQVVNALILIVILLSLMLINLKNVAGISFCNNFENITLTLFRLDSYQISRDLAIASLPSPAASLSDITQDSFAVPSDQITSENDCIILPSPPIPAALSGKRKRRLSDVGHDGPSKRPQNVLAVPRFQTVSDPLPLANPIINDFYKASSDNIPDPVSVEPLDDTPVEVDLYNYTFPDAIQPFWLTNLPSDPYLGQYFLF